MIKMKFKNEKKFLSVMFAVVMLTAVMFTGCGGEKSAQPEEVSAEEDKEPYILTFEAVTTEGEAFSSDCFSKSKLTMLNIWATYCNPCLQEMPDLGEIAASRDESEFQMIGIISDVKEDAGTKEIDAAKDLIIQTNAETYPHLLLGDSLYHNLVGAVNAVPMTFFVNQEGELLGYVEGSRSKEDWEAMIDGILEEE